MQTLIVYDQGNRGTELYLIPDAPEWIIGADGIILNSKEYPDDKVSLVYRIDNAISENPDDCIDINSDLAMGWVKYKLKAGTVISGPCQVVKCGWL